MAAHPSAGNAQAMSQSKFIGPATMLLLAGLWASVWLSGASDQTIGGLAMLTGIAGLMALLTLRR